MNIHVWWAVIHIPQVPHCGCSMGYKAKQTGKCSLCRLLLSIPPDPDWRIYCLTELGMQTCCLTLLPLHVVVPFFFFFLIALLSLQRWILIASPDFPLRKETSVRKGTWEEKHTWDKTSLNCWDGSALLRLGENKEDKLQRLPYLALLLPCLSILCAHRIFRIWQEKCESLCCIATVIKATKPYAPVFQWIISKVTQFLNHLLHWMQRRL